MPRLPAGTSIAILSETEPMASEIPTLLGCPNDLGKGTCISLEVLILAVEETQMNSPSMALSLILEQSLEGLDELIISIVSILFVTFIFNDTRDDLLIVIPYSFGVLISINIIFPKIKKFQYYKYYLLHYYLFLLLVVIHVTSIIVIRLDGSALDNIRVLLLHQLAGLSCRA